MNELRRITLNYLIYFYLQVNQWLTWLATAEEEDSEEEED